MAASRLWSLRHLTALRNRSLSLLAARSGTNVPSSQLRFIGCASAHFCRSKIDSSDVDAFRMREEERDREQSASLDHESTTSGGGSSSRSHDANADSEANAKRERVLAVRAQILDAALQHVHELGWSREALEAGAQNLQLPSVVHGLFPRGGVEIVEYFVGDCDRRLAEYLEQDAQQQILRPNEDAKAAATEAPPKQHLRNEIEFVANACQFRLQMVLPMMAKWPQAMGLRALPPNVPTALTQLMRMVDDICYHAGDRSTDLNWYTRRAAVAMLYKITELHLLQDKSADHQDTWAFLRRRIAELDGAQSLVTNSSQSVENTFLAVRSVGETIRNMAGIPFGR